jgi:quercetin dioxygenase-like cupin family protein
MSSLQSPEDGVVFNLDQKIEELRSLEPYEHEGRTARTLIHTDDLRVVLVVMKAGDRMKEHHANATATVQALSGELVLTLPEREVTLPAGRLLALGKGLRHDVQANGDSAFLLTLGWGTAKRDAQ